MKKTYLLLIAVLGMMCSPALWAGGFQVSLQGQKQIGMGHIGVSTPMDGSSLYFNPGAMSLLRGTQVTGSFSPVFPKIVFNQPSTGLESAIEPGVGTPFGLYVNSQLSRDESKFLSKLNLGVGVYTPFGSSIAYPDDWIGRYVTQAVTLTTVFIQPTISYNINDQIGIGVGIGYGLGNFSIQRAFPLSDAQGEGVLELAGTGTGIGANFGVYVEPIKNKLAVGVSYKTNTSVDIEDGDAKFDVPNSLAIAFPETTFNMNVTFPDYLSIGATYYFKLAENNPSKTKASFIGFELNRAGWKSYDALSFDFADDVGGEPSLSSARNYEDSYTFRLGAQHTLSDLLTVRAGLNYDQYAAPDCCVTPETPDANKLSFSGGLSIRPSDALSIDASFLWVEGEARTTINEESGFEQQYKARAFIPGIGVQFAF